LTEEEKGDSEILNYTLAFSPDDGVTWQILTSLSSPFTRTQFTKDTMIEAGLYYMFKVRAANIYGHGPYSPVFRFKAAEEPKILDSRTILTTNIETDVKISWAYPDDNGDTVTAYLIELRTQSGIVFFESPECDGKLAAIVVAR